MTTDATPHKNAGRVFEEERLVGEATDLLSDLVRQSRLRQRDVADRLGVTQSRVSQMLSGAESMSLRTFASFGWALGVRFELEPNRIASDETISTSASIPHADGSQAPRWVPPHRNTVRAGESTQRTRRLPLRVENGEARRRRSA